MIKPEQTPAFKKALTKVLGKLRVRPKYMIRQKTYGICLRDITALNDYLSIASDQDLKELSGSKIIADVVEDFKIHLVKGLVIETAYRKRVMEQEKKNLQAQKERQAKWAKEQEERLKKQQEAQKLLQVQMQPNFFTALKLTTEQKEILKKMVDAK